MTSKRGRDVEVEHPEDEGGESQCSKRVKSQQDIVYRIVVPSTQIGKVIGKLGSRIQKIRQDTRATIKIADALTRHEDRVIIISSKDSNDSPCDAQNALHQITDLIIREEDTIETVKLGLPHEGSNTVKLLIAGSQTGSLIGTSGQNIQKLRNSFGATIVVLEQYRLPPCASVDESDRVVQVSGEVRAVMKVVEELGSQLRMCPPPQAITISPTYNQSMGGRSVQQHAAADTMTAADYMSFQMVVPEALVGGLIGRSGSNISRIRLESGATIKVHGGKGEQRARQIQIGGTAQQVAFAKQRVDEYVYCQLLAQPSAALEYSEALSLNGQVMGLPFTALPNDQIPHPSLSGLILPPPPLYFTGQPFY